MSTDQDQENRRDTDVTDELPILIETVVLDPEAALKVADGDETGEHAASFLTVAAHEAQSVEALKHDLDRRAAKIEELERDIARHSKRRLEMERALADKDSQIGELSSALAVARTELAEHT